MKSPRAVALRLSGLVALALVLAVAAGAASSKAHASGGSAATATDWNLIAVNTVRAAIPAKTQVEGLIYMSYVQASVYDAVTKIEGRYQLYHDFTAPVDPTGASSDAAVAAAAYTALAYYFSAQAG